MNERIEKLAEQAGFQYIKDEGIGWAGNYNASLPKFAELIVGHATECVRDVLRDENSDLSYTAAAQVQNRIKQHFGVAE